MIACCMLHITNIWDFAIINTGNYSPYLMRGILKNLEDVQKLPDEDFPFKKQVCLYFL